MNAYSEPRQSKNQRRQEAREKARELREQQSKQSKRKKIVLQSSIAVVVLAIIGVVTFFITSSVTPQGPGPRNMASDGIKIGQGFVAERTDALQPEGVPTLSAENPDGVAAINIFIDYSCTHCAQFEVVYSELFRNLGTPKRRGSATPPAQEMPLPVWRIWNPILSSITAKCCCLTSRPLRTRSA